jgi:hypothetical protein
VVFSLAFAIIVASVCKTMVLDNKLPDPTNLTFHGIFGVTLLIGALTRRKALVIFAMALFVLYIALLFTRMR